MTGARPENAPAIAARPAPAPSASAAARASQARTGLAWLAGAMAALAILAIAAAVVSWDAQYVMVARARHTPVIAALEAGIPDAGAAVFAALGIALALHGRRALRPRILNVACVSLSVAMNAMASAPGWRNTAIWIMPAALYALASDTLIGVVRAWAIARTRATGLGGPVLAGDDATPLAVAGACLLWLLRLLLAPASTLAGFRRWVMTECPAAPRRAPARSLTPTTPHPPGLQPRSPASRRRDTANGKPRKQDLLIALAGQRHDLRTLPLSQASAIATAISAEVNLHPGTARRVLRTHVRALQDHSAAL